MERHLLRNQEATQILEKYLKQSPGKVRSEMFLWYLIGRPYKAINPIHNSVSLAKVNKAEATEVQVYDQNAK